MSKIAFLLLTYEEHDKHKQLEKFFSQGNVYVHAKYPDKIKSYLKHHIIKEYVDTKWGDISIVKAEIKLLENAYANPDNKWFVLMSQSCFPLLTFTKLKKELDKNGNTLSFFHFVKNDKKMYKTSQFWILNREDTEIIIRTQSKYLNLYKNVKVLDERYFLSVLMSENKNYKFINKTVTYSRWIEDTNLYHPFTFNKITQYDVDEFNTNNYFFFRKITAKFSFTPLVPKKNLIVLYADNLDKTITVKQINEKLKDACRSDVGSSSSSSSSYDTCDNFDLIIFYTTYGYESLPQKIMDKAIYLLHIHHNEFDNTYKMFTKHYHKLLLQWKNIIPTKI
jgi:hypothetical protein